MLVSFHCTHRIPGHLQRQCFSMTRNAYLPESSSPSPGRRIRDRGLLLPKPRLPGQRPLVTIRGTAEGLFGNNDAVWAVSYGTKRLRKETSPLFLVIISYFPMFSRQKCPLCKTSSRSARCHPWCPWPRVVQGPGLHGIALRPLEPREGLAVGSRVSKILSRDLVICK